MFKSDSKDIYNVQINAVLFTLIFIKEFSTKILSSTTVFNIDDDKKVSWVANQHIRMISEESCDTEDKSNDAENSALITEINYILKYIQTEKNIVIIFHFLLQVSVCLIK